MFDHVWPWARALGLFRMVHVEAESNRFTAKKGSLLALASRLGPNPATLPTSPEVDCRTANDGAGVNGITHPAPCPPCSFWKCARSTPVMRSPSI